MSEWLRSDKSRVTKVVFFSICLSLSKGVGRATSFVIQIEKYEYKKIRNKDESEKDSQEAQEAQFQALESTDAFTLALKFGKAVCGALFYWGLIVRITNFSIRGNITSRQTDLQPGMLFRLLSREPILCIRIQGRLYEILSSR